MAYTTTKTVYGHINKIAVDQELKGKFEKIKGFGFPVGSKVGSPYFFTEISETLIKNNLKQLLSTHPGERIMLPDFGCNLRRFLFQPLDITTIEAIKRQVATSINKYLTSVFIEEIKIEDVDEIGADGNQVINIQLRVRIRDETNLVFYTEVKIG